MFLKTRTFKALLAVLFIFLLWLLGRNLFAVQETMPVEPAATVTTTAESMPTEMPTQMPTQEPAPAPTATMVPTADTGYQQAVQFAGHWEGEWVNTTFGSSGPIVADVTVNPDGSLTLTLDVDGEVFGLYDPPPVTYTGHFDLHAAEIVIADDPVWGNALLTFMEGGAFYFEAALVPDVEIASMTIDGSFSPDATDGAYLITFVGGDVAEGTIAVNKAE